MRIKRLELENFRGFQKAAVDFPEGNVAVFFGWNGAGKTAVLDAMAMLLSNAFDLGVTAGFEVKLTYEDIRKGSEYCIVASYFDKLGKSVIQGSINTDSNSTEIHSILPQKANIFSDLNESNLPVLAYYKTNRELKPDREYAPYSPYSGQRNLAYADAFEIGMNDFDLFVSWFKHEEDLENQQKIEKRDFNWESPRLKSIRRSISVFLSKMDADFVGLKVQRQSDEGIDFYKPSKKLELYIQKSGQEFKLSQLSSGERSLILLVADIARRASVLNPHLDDPLQSPGIVLIDEIELHLHPKWQRAVIAALQATFPNIQFIIATHSPQVLSEVENGGVFEIDNFQIHPRSTYGRDNNWLLHVIMEDDERPEEVQHYLEEYFTLLRSGQLDAAARLRQQIEEKIGSDEPEFVKADILLRRKERSLAS